MSLKELNLKGLYDSDRDDLLNDFYIPVLSESVYYKRIAGFFSSNALAIAAKGISKLIGNGGKIQLIANVIISEKDQEAIKKAIHEKESKLINEIEGLQDALKKGHIRLLAWMIKNDKLDIKIAVVSEGIEHKKKGVLEDKEGNKISFSGSDNETVKGWIENDEEFHVFCSWREGDKEIHLKPDIDSFDKLWNNQANKVRTYPVSEAFKRGLIRTAPKNDEEFKELSKEVTEGLLRKNMERIKKIQETKRIKLRSFQKEAIIKWKEKNFVGIFEMATGVGKTISALGCLEELSKIKERLVTVITCPYNHLITQWENEIKRFGIKDKIIIADSSNKKWKTELTDYTTFVNKEFTTLLMIITTYKTFSSEFFIQQINKFKKDIFLIADEMHWSGAKTFSKGLIDKYNFKLGLSATPERYFDDSGSRFIVSYFGGTVYEFGLKRAINEVNSDTGKSYLTPYNYYPHFVELDLNEFDDYINITKKMSRIFKVKKDKQRREEILQRLAEKRQKIIVNASAKLDILKGILNNLKEIKHLLIYCSDKQIDNVQRILGDIGVINHRFTGEEDISPNVKYGGISQRDFLLKKFADGTYQSLVAMKCLDEGVDVPPARIAIILASSGNPKEYIQRRGRILRRYEGKERADIFDILVVPSLTGNIPEETKETEKNIILKEIKRYEEFANIANNRLEALNKIFPIKRKYGLA